MSTQVLYKTKKFSELAEAYEVDDKSKFLIHDGKGLKRISKADFDKKFTDWKGIHEPMLIVLEQNGAPFHNNIYRGKYLGDQFTDEQHNVIADGTFKDMYIGDYWEIKGYKYRIAAFNYYYMTGDFGQKCYKNHITLVSDKIIDKKPMDTRTTTTSGYLKSTFRVEQLPNIRKKIEDLFNKHVLKHRRLLSSASENGRATKFEWDDSDIEVMNESQVYGISVCSNGNCNITNDNRQFPLFAMDISRSYIEETYWLHNIYNKDSFACVLEDGNADARQSSIDLGIRITFSIN